MVPTRLLRPCSRISAPPAPFPVKPSPWAAIAEKLGFREPHLWGDALDEYGEPLLKQFESMRVLVAVEPLDSLGWCDCGEEKCELEVQRDDGKVYAVCASGQNPPQEITEESLRVFKVNQDEFLRRFAAANDLVGPPQVVDPDATILGHLPAGRVDPVVFVRGAADGIAMLRALLRVACPESGGVVLFPRDPKLSEGDRALLTLDGFQVIVLAKALQGASTLRLTWPVKNEPAREVVPEIATGSARLVIWRRARRATLDGRELQLQRKAFDLLEYLANQVTPEKLPVPTGRIFEDVWAKENANDVEFFESQVDEHVSRLRSAVRACLDLSLAEARALVFNAKGTGYGLGLIPEEVDFRDEG